MRRSTEFSIQVIFLQKTRTWKYIRTSKKVTSIWLFPGPTLFPYNEATQWCFKKFDANTTTIVRKQGKRVASLRPEDIGLRYHLPTPTCALNEPFLKGFSQGNKGPVKLMKHWWVMRMRPSNKDKIWFPPTGSRHHINC
jgi:hypothetical protein